jgi:hypothetical protein
MDGILSRRMLGEYAVIVDPKKNSSVFVFSESSLEAEIPGKVVSGRPNRFPFPPHEQSSRGR